jgi:hypothetical protein
VSTPGTSSTRPAAAHRERQRSNAVIVYALVLVSLQIFLLTVAVEGLLADEDSLALAAAGLSAFLFVVALAFGHLLRHG